MLKKLRKRLVRTPAPASRHFIPRLGHLEDRLAPATISVTTRLDVVSSTDGLVSLREAISMANATAEADTIELKGGVYRISLAGGGEDANATGDFDITNTVTIVGTGALTTVIEGSRVDRVFHVMGSTPSSIRAVFNGVTIRNGVSIIQAAPTTPDGGGIMISNASLRLVDSAVTGNHAAGKGGGISNAANTGTGDVTLIRTLVNRNTAGSDGGGVYLGGSSLQLTDSTMRRNFSGHWGGGAYADFTNLTRSEVSGNVATSEGGGLYAFNTANLIDSTLRNNSALSADGFGGGVVTTNAFLTRCRVTGNSAGHGAGVATTGGSLTQTIVSGNHATGDGGGVYAVNAISLNNSSVNSNFANRGAGIFATTATATNSTISSNIANSFGGGIAAPATNLTNSTVSYNIAGGSGGGINAATVNLTNSTVSGNTTGADGGGIYASHGRLLNSTIVENFAAVEGGGVSWAGESDPIRVKNTIIALNLAPASNRHDVDGLFLSEGNNLIGVVDGSTGFGAAGDQLGTLVAPLDPKLGVLQNNGGATLTHAPLKGSSTIDRGSNSGAPGTDQRGVVRPRDGDFNASAIVDIGAIEV